MQTKINIAENNNLRMGSSTWSRNKPVQPVNGSTVTTDDDKAFIEDLK